MGFPGVPQDPGSIAMNKDAVSNESGEVVMGTLTALQPAFELGPLTAVELSLAFLATFKK